MSRIATAGAYITISGALLEAKNLNNFKTKVDAWKTSGSSGKSSITVEEMKSLDSSDPLDIPLFYYAKDEGSKVWNFNILQGKRKKARTSPLTSM